MLVIKKIKNNNNKKIKKIKNKTKRTKIRTKMIKILTMFPGNGAKFDNDVGKRSN